MFFLVAIFQHVTLKRVTHAGTVQLSVGAKKGSGANIFGGQTEVLEKD
jgi:hypothetical protein